MFQKIKDVFIKKLIIKGIVGQLEKLFASLPQNDSKTLNGFLISCIGLVLSTLPETSEFAQPILDYLQTLPAEEIVAGGILWSAVGLFHKGLKWIIKAVGYKTAKEKALEKERSENVKR